MKVISIKQPWAYCIIECGKDVENRTWRSEYCGELLIHASKSFDFEGYEFIRSYFGLTLPSVSDFKRGGIVGQVTMISCVENSNSMWFFGPYGFVFKNPRKLPFVPCNGALGIYDKQFNGFINSYSR